ncbi:hypothetical protein E2C01_037257 [Portunus trituberculatus]|uniref:Uncharacterized protein n=1 Tax=Portunus trituberculatus TaxID=210409 RepID=A0A5B7FDI2_PORTR|nr:hypothetical protein [Portunus trituberculatus]
MLTLYKGFIRPCMECSLHVWGYSTHTALSDRMESKAFRLINSPPLTDFLQPLSHHRNVASLSIFNRYFHANISIVLANCFLLPLNPNLSNLFSFIPFTSKLWNSLPSIFPSSYDLTSFKKEVSRHLSLNFD